MGFVSKAVGGIVGKIQSGFGADAPQNNFQPTAYKYDPNSYAPTEANKQLTSSQLSFVNGLNNRINNPNASAVVPMLNQAEDKNAATQFALANSSNGANPALALKIAETNAANANNAAAANAASARNAEIANAGNTLNSAYSTGFGNQNTQENNAMKLQEDQGAQQQNMNAINSGVAQSNVQARTQQSQGIDNALAGAVALGVKSDKNSKKNIEPESEDANAGDVKGGHSDLYDFLEKMKAYKYDYKDPSEPGAAEGKHYSPMAQDLEKTKVGESLVKNTPTGKMVDYSRGFGAILAAQAQLHDRMKKLEGRAK